MLEVGGEFYEYGSIAWQEAVCSKALCECLRRAREERAIREGGQYWLPMHLPERRRPLVNWPWTLPPTVDNSRFGILIRADKPDYFRPHSAAGRANRSTRAYIQASASAEREVGFFLRCTGRNFQRFVGDVKVQNFFLKVLCDVDHGHSLLCCRLTKATKAECHHPAMVAPRSSEGASLWGTETSNSITCV